VELNGTLASKITDRTATDKLGSDSETPVKIAFRRQGRQREVDLYTEGLAHILSRTDSSGNVGLDGTTVAQAQ
jgi:hypothetical protein